MRPLHYEMIVRDNKAARLRAFDAMVASGCQMIDSYVLAGDVVVVLVGAKTVDSAKRCEERAKAVSFHYESPRWFDNGTLRPYYHTPEDQLAGKRARGAPTDDSPTIARMKDYLVEARDAFAAEVAKAEAIAEEELVQRQRAEKAEAALVNVARSLGVDPQALVEDPSIIQRAEG